MSTLPDTGTRTSFNTGAVRDGASGKGTPNRIPPIAIRKMAQRFEDGATKYPDTAPGKPNWMQGIPLSRYQDAIVRHLMQWAEGDTSEDHLGAVLWNAACAAWTEQAIADGRLPAELMDLPFRQVATPTPLTLGELNRQATQACNEHGRRIFIEKWMREMFGPDKITEAVAYKTSQPDPTAL